MGKWLFSLLILPGLMAVAADSYADWMDRAEKLMEQRYSKGSRAYKIKSAELDDILKGSENSAEKIGKLKKFVADFADSTAPAAEKPSAAKPLVPEETANPGVPSADAADLSRGAAQSLYDLGMKSYTGNGRAKDYAAAMKYFRDAAENGLPAGAAMVGRLYFEGSGVPVNYVEAYKWLRLASMKDVEATALLGLMNYKGMGVPRNCEEAGRCFQYVAEISPKHKTALFSLGMMSFEGNGTVQDYKKARAYFEKISDVSPEAMRMLGGMYQDGLGVEKDSALALKWYRSAFSRGDRDSAFLLGKLYESEKGDGSRAEAEKYYRIAVENGNDEAKFSLAKIYAARAKSLSQENRREAIEWLLPSVEKGDTKSMVLLSDLYMEQNPQEAVKYLNRAARQDDAGALYRLGMIYFDGKLATRSYDAAFRCFSKSFENGNRDSRRKLAVLYYEGKGTIRNPEKAFKLYKELYDEGDVSAGIPLGTMCYSGDGTAKDCKKALEYLNGAKNSSPAVPGFNPSAVIGKIHYYGGDGVPQNFALAAEFLKGAGSEPESLYLLGKLYLEGKGLKQDDGQAFSCFRHAAELGSMEAKAELGKMYCLGRGTPHDYALAVQYLKPAADRGDLEAGRLLGELYTDGKSPRKDDTAAFRYFRALAEKGDADALLRCGKMCLEGRGTGRDREAAMRYLKDSASKGDAEAMFLCGQMLLEKKDAAGGAKYMRSAALEGHPEAMKIFAGMALSGEGMKADPSLAAEFLRRLAEKGDVPSLEKLAGLYENGAPGLEADAKLAEEFYEKAAAKGSVASLSRLARLHFGREDYEGTAKYVLPAAAKGDPDAVGLLGRMYYEGKGVRKDTAEALRLLKMSADRGDSYAVEKAGLLCYAAGDYAGAEKYLSSAVKNDDPELLYMLGRICYLGVGVKQDYSRAFELLARSADRGNIDSMVLIGKMYHRGEGFSQDYARALQWYKRAAEKGSSEAMYNVGSMYYNGDGVSPDYLEAIRWFKQSAEKGNIVAMQYVAIMYKEGIGVPKDNVEASLWRKKAAESKN